MDRERSSRLGSIRAGDREIVDAFVAFIKQDLGIIAAEAQYPDDINRSSPDADATYAHLAIEHTSIDSIPGQRENNAKFQLIFIPIGEEFAGKVTEHYWISLSFGDVHRMKRPAQAQEIVRCWLREQVIPLELGYHRDCLIPALNIRAQVTKRSDLKSGVNFLRSASPDPDLPGTLRALITRKSDKLVRYKRR